MINLYTAAELRALLKIESKHFEKIVRDPAFPKPVMFGTRKRRWRETDIAAWLEGK